MSSKYEELIKYVKQTEALSHASGLIAWDQETKMPKGSVEQRADTLSVLESEIHKRKSNKYVEELIYPDLKIGLLDCHKESPQGL